MERGKIQIKAPERFMGNHAISTEKLDAAIKKATDKLRSKLDIYQYYFPQNSLRRAPRSHHVYLLGGNVGWTAGMLTGCMNLAYDLTKEQCFMDTALSHLSTYEDKLKNSADPVSGMNDHDVGFMFSPSCVGLYKRTGNEKAREIALGAARHLYNVSYSQRGGFIMLDALLANDQCKTIADTVMNVPLLFWAGNELDMPHLKEAAHSQNKITRDYLIREDGSSYHHYKFDVDTHKPVGGVTYQGNRNESTWSRGHAWSVYEFPIAFSYTEDKSLLDVHKDVVAFMLNHLPKDNIPYWDYDFVDGDEPRDTSAAVISASGLLNAINYLPANAIEREIYFNAANMIIEAVIDRYTGDLNHNNQIYDGLLYGCTGSCPHGINIEGCALYGDYFYLESLLRLKYPDYKYIW